MAKADGIARDIIMKRTLGLVTLSAILIWSAGIAAWESHLTHLGIDIESRVRWDGGGTSLYFRDPEGRSVEFATPGVWPTY